MDWRFYFKILFVFLVVVFLLWSAFPARADGLVPCSGPDCTLCHLFALVNRIVNYVIKYFMPPLAGLLFLVGGIMMVAAGASEENYKKGKTILVNTAIGVVIVLAAWVIVNSLITMLAQSVSVGGVTFNPVNWWRGMNCQN